MSLSSFRLIPFGSELTHPVIVRFSDGLRTTTTAMIATAAAAAIITPIIVPVLTILLIRFVLRYPLDEN